MPTLLTDINEGNHSQQQEARGGIAICGVIILCLCAWLFITQRDNSKDSATIESQKQAISINK
jgi:hypothetical protein